MRFFRTLLNSSIRSWKPEMQHHKRQLQTAVNIMLQTAINTRDLHNSTVVLHECP